MVKITLRVALFVTSVCATQGTDNLHSEIETVFTRIYNVSDTVFTRLERQTAEKQQQLLTVTLSFTLFESFLLVTSLILHVVSVAVLRHSRILPQPFFHRLHFSKHHQRLAT